MHLVCYKLQETEVDHIDSQNYGGSKACARSAHMTAEQSNVALRVILMRHHVAAGGERKFSHSSDLQLTSPQSLRVESAHATEDGL